MSNLEKLVETIKILRSPNGCDWDKAQTHKTIRQNMLEEAYEAVDAINSGDVKHLKEELGDVLLQVVLHAQIAEDEGEFNIEDVAGEINEKLIRRHPHVFSGVEVHSVDEILENWEEIKKQEKTHRKSVLDGISKSQSALMTAAKLSKKAVKAGFEWACEDDVWSCLESEIKEFKNAKNFEDKEEEFGDILFALVNVARWNKIDPEQALIRSNTKFDKRFRDMEKNAIKELTELTLSEWDELWQLAKKNTAEN
ncbi:nucleoside triphosphate pyrophosphohydrolase [bacterium]|nr:nucleoside triphosphate pyrophosphohydrolase [bacterium]